MLPAIKNMTTEEKLALVEELWEDIEKDYAEALSHQQIEHIKARIKAHEDAGNQGKTWEMVKKKYT